jgi:hypothetical protein
MEAVVALAAVLLVVVGVFFFVSARRARQPQHVLTSPRMSGLTIKPLAETLLVVPRPPQAVAPVAAAPPALFDVDLEPPVSVPQPTEIRWARQFDPRSGTLDDTARLRLIGDLGVIAKDWCVPLLAAAYQEERRPGYRQAALIALAACRSRAAAPTFTAVLASGDQAERAIAVDGLADLEPPPQQNKIRRTVERH